MDNAKVIIKETRKYGKGLFAREDIKKGQVIARFDGEVFEAEKCSLLPNEPPLLIRDHAIQFEENKWKDSKGFARFTNHSCNPNCGIKNYFEIMAMKNIKKGEEITFDYEMTEDSDWRMECKCGSMHCRKIIGAYKNMPEEIRKKYKGYISKWLINLKTKKLINTKK